MKFATFIFALALPAVTLSSKTERANPISVLEGDDWHEVQVIDPHGQPTALRIFARDLADPAVAVKSFCALHGFAGVETCAQDIMHGLAPELDRLRGRHAAAIQPWDSLVSTDNHEQVWQWGGGGAGVGC